MIGALLALCLEVADVPRRPLEYPRRQSAQSMPPPVKPPQRQQQTVRVVPPHLTREQYRAAIKRLRRMQKKAKRS